MTPVGEIVLLSTGAGAAGLAVLATTVPTDATGLEPYLGAGAGVVAVAALAEVTRRLLNGRLIPRETKDFEEELTAAVVASGQREERLIRIVEDVRDEMRALRREIERA